MAKQRNYSKKDIMGWKFKGLLFPEEWQEHLGAVDENFRMLVTGPSGHGKTTYVLQLTKMLAEYYGKVNYNSCEQGKGPTFKNQYIQNKMYEIKGGKWMLSHAANREFNNWFNSLSKINSGRVIVLDSRDYMNLTVEEFKKLELKFKHKSIIIVAWSDPIDINTKKIRYMCDIKIEVLDYKAKVRSRFGGRKTYEIKDGDGSFAHFQSVMVGANDGETIGMAALIRVEEIKLFEGMVKVLIYEDQPEQITLEKSHELFEQYPEVMQIHEVNEKWGGVYIRGKEEMAEVFKLVVDEQEAN